MYPHFIKAFYCPGVYSTLNFIMLENVYYFTERNYIFRITRKVQSWK